MYSDRCNEGGRGVGKVEKKRKEREKEARARETISGGKETEQRKSIVRLLIEKWGRFMGYR